MDIDEAGDKRGLWRLTVLQKPALKSGTKERRKRMPDKEKFRQSKVVAKVCRKNEKTRRNRKAVERRREKAVKRGKNIETVQSACDCK
jgi:hypothetical protein